jgi:capsular polysaccharide transport system permease protein
MHVARAPDAPPPLREVARDGGDVPLPDAAEALAPAPRRARWWRRVPAWAWIVLLPTLLVVAFEYLVVADQYESEAHFIVRSPQPAQATGGLGQLLGLSGGAVPADAHSVGDYLLSHDAVAALSRRLPLAAMFRRPEADIASRLWDARPAPETLLRYYRGKVHADYGSETGITRLSARAFRPDDAKRLADALLELGERRVNGLNGRMLRDGLAVAEGQVVDAARQLALAQSDLTGFRQGGRDIDPERTGAAQIGMATALRAQAAAAQAQLAAMRGVIVPTAPQYVALARRAAALDAQVDAAQARLAGTGRTVAAGLGTYEALRLRQELAAKRYQSATAALDGAREQLLRQQLFIVRVVEPNLPVKSLYPKRLKIVATVFFGLLLSYAIGWLILAGVREHAS